LLGSLLVVLFTFGFFRLLRSFCTRLLSEFLSEVERASVNSPTVSSCLRGEPWAGSAKVHQVSNNQCSFPIAFPRLSGYDLSKKRSQIPKASVIEGGRNGKPLRFIFIESLLQSCLQCHPNPA